MEIQQAAKQAGAESRRRRESTYNSHPFPCGDPTAPDFLPESSEEKGIICWSCAPLILELREFAKCLRRHCKPSPAPSSKVLLFQHLQD